jgi:hypothetical protein
MRKLVVLSGILLLVLAGVHGCQAKPIISGRATVTYVSLTGGFWGIISEKSDNGTWYFDPVFLPFRFHRDGLRVWFIGILLPYIPNIQMWGDTVLIKKNNTVVLRVIGDLVL